MRGTALTNGIGGNGRAMAAMAIDGIRGTSVAMGALGGSGAMEALGVTAAQQQQSLQMNSLSWHQRPQSRQMSNRKQRQTLASVWQPRQRWQ
jgi:hypothetical protein